MFVLGLKVERFVKQISRKLPSASASAIPLTTGSSMDEVVANPRSVPIDRQTTVVK